MQRPCPWQKAYYTLHPTSHSTPLPLQGAIMHVSVSVCMFVCMCKCVHACVAYAFACMCVGMHHHQGLEECLNILLDTGNHLTNPCSQRVRERATEIWRGGGGLGGEVTYRQVLKHVHDTIYRERMFTL